MDSPLKQYARDLADARARLHMANRRIEELETEVKWLRSIVPVHHLAPQPNKPLTEVHP